MVMDIDTVVLWLADGAMQAGALLHEWVVPDPFRMDK